VTKGIIYILTNEAMPGYTKIGKTTNKVEERIKSRDTTGVPLPFQCYFAAIVEDADKDEYVVGPKYTHENRTLDFTA